MCLMSERKRFANRNRIVPKNIGNNSVIALSKSYDVEIINRRAKKIDPFSVWISR